MNNNIKVLKIDIGCAITIDDINNLPSSLEILYIPFYDLDINNLNFNFPISLKEIYIGHLNYKKRGLSFDSEDNYKFKIPYGCKLYRYFPYHDCPGDFNEVKFWRMEFNKAKKAYKKREIQNILSRDELNKIQGILNL
jgi:hypothetical protein